MSDYSTWFKDRKNRKGEVVGQIRKQMIYESLSSEIVQKIEENLPANRIVDWIKEQTKIAHYQKYGIELKTGALNNAAGDWNEFMVTSAFSEIAIEMNSKCSGLTVAVFPLPNMESSAIVSSQTSSRFLALFKQSAFEVGGELNEINSYKDRIFFSSPDYIVVLLERNRLSEIQPLLERQARRPNVNVIYRYLRGTLDPHELKAAISVKTEYRPDRRYQPLFEATLVKQLGYVGKQNWKFYMVSSKETGADTSLFDRVTTPDAYAHDYKLVDGSFLFLRKADLIRIIESAIS